MQAMYCTLKKMDQRWSNVKYANCYVSTVRVTFWLTVLLSRHCIRVSRCVPVTRHGDTLVCLAIASLPVVPGPVGTAGPPSAELAAGPPAGHLAGHLAILWIQSVGVDVGARPGSTSS